MAGQGEHVLYGGSRKLKQRFDFRENSKSGSVELHFSFLLIPEEFKVLL